MTREQLEKRIDECSKLHKKWYIDYHTTNGKTDRRHKNLCNDEMESLRIEMRVLETELSMVDKITELDRVLQQTKQEFPELEEPNHYKMGNDLLMRDIEVLKIQVKKGKDLISQLEKQNEDLKFQISLLEDGLIPLKDLNDTLELESFRKLQSEVHLGIERVWNIDSYDYSNNPYDIKERSEIIEEIFYKIGNEWIGGDYRAGLQKRTDPERWESLDDMDGSWTEDDIEKGNHLPF